MLWLEMHGPDEDGLIIHPATLMTATESTLEVRVGTSINCTELAFRVVREDLGIHFHSTAQLKWQLPSDDGGYLIGCEPDAKKQWNALRLDLFT